MNSEGKSRETLARKSSSKSGKAVVPSSQLPQNPLTRKMLARNSTRLSADQGTVPFSERQGKKSPRSSPSQGQSSVYDKIKKGSFRIRQGLERISPKGSRSRNDMNSPASPSTIPESVSPPPPLTLGESSQHLARKEEKENILRASLETLIFSRTGIPAEERNLIFAQLKELALSQKPSEPHYLHLVSHEIGRALSNFAGNEIVLEQACTLLGMLANNSPLIQEAIVNTEAIHLIVAGMRSHLESGAVQDKALCALVALSGSELAREQIIAEGGAECICRAMKEFKDFRSILMNGATALSNIAKNSADRGVIVGTAGGIDAIAMAMNRHNADKDLQAHASLVLCHLTQGIQENRIYAKAAKTIHIVVSSMMLFENDVRVQLNGCMAVESMCNSDCNEGKDWEVPELVEACFGAVSRNIENSVLLEHGFAALILINSDSQDNRGRSEICEGLNITLRALQLHHMDEKVSTKATHLLRTLLFSKRSREAMVCNGGLDVLVGMLRDTALCPPVAANALLGISNAICDQPLGKQVVGQIGGIFTVVEVMSKHVSNENIQENACRALRNLADSDELNVQLIGACQAAEKVTAAMMLYPDNSDLQEQACALLFNMSFSNPNLRIIQELEVPKILDHVLPFHSENRIVLYQAQALLSWLGSATREPKFLVNLGNRESIQT